MRALSLAVLIIACGAPPKQTVSSTEPLPEFTLTDVNPASKSTGQGVTPMSLRGKVSGWYFTHTG